MIRRVQRRISIIILTYFYLTTVPREVFFVPKRLSYSYILLKNLIFYLYFTQIIFLWLVQFITRLDAFQRAMNVGNTLIQILVICFACSEKHLENGFFLRISDFFEFSSIALFNNLNFTIELQKCKVYLK